MTKMNVGMVLTLTHDNDTSFAMYTTETFYRALLEKMETTNAKTIYSPVTGEVVDMDEIRRVIGILEGFNNPENSAWIIDNK